MTGAVGIDVGGTKLLAGVVDHDGGVIERRRVATPSGGADDLIEALVELAGGLGAGLPLGIGIAGTVDRRGRLRYAPNLPIRELPLRERLAERLGIPVHVANDASAAAAGEWRSGAGRGVDELMMLTVGTGVGGGLISGGRLLTGADGMAGELGHLIVREGGRPCPCGNRGCLEAYASGSAIETRARERLDDPGASSSLRDLGRDPDGRAVTDAADAGDALAREVLQEAGWWLGVGIAGLVNVFDPARVLIGGGAGVNAAPVMLPAARASAAERIIGNDHRDPPEIVPAALGDDAGMIGAALLALEAAL